MPTFVNKCASKFSLLLSDLSLSKLPARHFPVSHMSLIDFQFFFEGFIYL